MGGTAETTELLYEFTNSLRILGECPNCDGKTMDERGTRVTCSDCGYTVHERRYVV